MAALRWLEIMVVLVIIAVMSGVALLQIGSSSSGSFVAEANKISATLETLADEAVYTNSIITCNVGINFLSCTRYKNGDWQDIYLNKLVSWNWPKTIEVKQVVVDGSPLKGERQIRFTASGEIQPISLQVTDSVHSTWIDGDMDGNFVVNN